MDENKLAYATILSTDSYLPGVLALFESIKRTNTKIKNFVVVVNESIKPETKQRLAESGCTVVEKPGISVPDKIKAKNKILPYWNNTFDKFNLFDLSDYDKIVYLDSDVYVNQNIDELFDKPNMSAVAAGKSYPGNESWRELNSGVMVIEPKSGVREELIKKMNEMAGRRRTIRKAISPSNKRFFSPKRKLSNLKSKVIKAIQGIGGQDVLEEFFRWKNRPELHLDEKYNIFAQYTDYYSQNSNKKGLSCIHFIGAKKPWNLNSKELARMKDNLKGKRDVQAEFLEKYLGLINGEAEKYKAKFSLIIPMKNAEKYIGNCLDSIRSQDYDNIEIIIVNDNSSDSSKKQVQEYQRNHPEMKIKLLNTVENHRGPGGARNIGLDNAQGAYVLFLDSDDKLNEGALNSISRAIALNPETDIFTLGYQLTRLDMDGNKVGNLNLNAGKIQESRFFQVGANTAGTIWNLCTRRSLFEKRPKVRFKENCKFEDVPTKVELFTRTKRKIKAVRHLTHTQFSRPVTSVTGTLSFKDMKRLVDANLEIANLKPNVDSKDKIYINVRIALMPIILGWLAQKCIHNKIDLAKSKKKYKEEQER